MSLLVCVGGSKEASVIVHAGCRLAKRLGAPWIVLYISTPSHDRLAEEEKDSIAAALGLAERLGAEAVTLPAQSGIAREIVGFAKAHDITHIVLGRPRRGLQLRLFSEPVASNVVGQAEGVEIIFVSPPKGRATAVKMPTARRPRQVWWRDFAWANVGVAAATVVAAALETTFSGPHLALIFLTAVLLIAAGLGVWPALYASGLSFLSFAFFFATPYYSLLAVNPQDVFTLALFLLVATLTGNLAGRLKRQVDSMRAAAHTTTNLYELSRKVAAAGALDDVIRAAVEHVASALECRSLIHERRLLIGETLIHHLDVLRWLAGPLRVVGARIQRAIPEVEGETVAAILLETAGGTPLVITATTAARGFPARTQDRLIFVGHKGTAILEGSQLQLLGPNPRRDSYDFDEGYQASFDGAISHFIECLRSGDHFETDPVDNLETLRLVENAYRMAE
jgi:nucleotide-binding universal stress UspA family protein